MSDPRKYKLDEAAARQFHAKLLTSDRFSVKNIGTEDEFINKLAGDPDNLLKFRNGLIEKGAVTAESVGGSDSIFLQKFLKKKDESYTSSKSSDITPEESSEIKPVVPTQEVDAADASYFDYHNPTLYEEGGAAHIASSYKNKYLADRRFEENIREVEKQTDEDMNEVSNVLAEKRQEINLGADRKEMKKQWQGLEDDLEKQFNPHNRKNTTVRIRKQMAAAFSDDLHGDLLNYMKVRDIDPYDALTNTEAVISDWRKRYKKGDVPGEVLDAAETQLRGEFSSIVIDKEYDDYILPQVEEYKKHMSKDEAHSLVQGEREARMRKHFEENINKKELDRYEKQEEIIRLMDEDPEGNADRISKLQEEMKKFGPLMYDEQGRRVIQPETEDQQKFELEVTKAIDQVAQHITSREQLAVLLDEQYMIYENLHRNEMARSQAFAREAHDQPATQYGHIAIVSPQDKKDAIYSSRVLHDAEIKLVALERMFYMNENLALIPKGRKEGVKGYYSEVFFDGIRDANQGRLGTKVTRAETHHAFPEIMAELGEQISDVELEGMAPDLKEELAHGAGGMADFVVKVALAEGLLGVSGVSAGVKSFSQGRKIMTAYKTRRGAGLKAGQKFALRATNKLEESLIKAGMNEARFQAGGMEPGHGAAFHYVDKGVGRVVPILLRRGNKHLAMVANSLARNPMTMTASMEIVATTQGAIEALANNKIVSEEMKHLFGDINAVERRIAVELMLGAMFGFGEVAKAGKKGIFEFTPDYILRLQKKAIKNGRLDVAAELGDIKYKLTEADHASNEAKNTQKKIEYLLDQGVEAKELYTSKKNIKGKGNRVNINKVNEEFDMRAVEDPALYDRILGEGTLEKLQAKAKILKKSGIDIEGHSPGNIDTMYETYKHKPKIGPKIQKQTELHEISMRRKTAKTVAKKLKEENVGEGFSESTDADMEIRKSKQTVRSEAEREFIKSYRRTRRDTSKNRVDQWGEKYKRSVQGEWGPESATLTEQMISSVDGALNMMNQLELKGNHYNKLKAAKKVLETSLKNGKAMSNRQADSVMKRITDSQNAFTVTAMRDNITTSIRKPAKKGTDRLDPKGVDARTSMIMKSIDRMFNRPKVESDIAKGSEKQVEAAEKRMDEFRTTEKQVDEMLKAKGKDPELYEGQDFTVYEGISDAMKSGTTYKSALNRRAELRRKAETEVLSEREMIEYEVLGFVDGQKMSMNQLAEAHRALKSLINNGRTEYKVKQEHDQLRERYERYEAVQAIDPKSVDVNTKIITPDIRHLNLIQRTAKSGRALVESLPTMMEWLQSKTPGRPALTGPLHNYTNRALKAGNDKAAEMGYFVKEMIDLETQIFGSPKEAESFFKNWRNEHEFIILRKDPNTGEMMQTVEKMSIQDAMTIRAYSRQADQVRTFENRGWTPESVKLLEHQITEFGGKEAISWADAIVDGILPRIWSRVNSRYRQDVGTDLTIIERYFPVARKFDSKTNTGDPFTLESEPLKNVRSTHTSSSKERNPDAANWYKLNRANDLSFNDLLYRHLDHSMQYVHYQQLVKDMNAVFRNEDVMAVIESGFTGKANTYINTMINDIGRGRIGAEKMRELDQIRTAFVRSKLGLNLTLLPKQLMSINAYQAEMSPAESIQFFKYMANPSIKTMKGLGRSRDIRLRYEKSQWDRDLALVEHGLKTAAGQSKGKIQLSRGEGLEKFTLTNLKDNALIMTKYGDYGAIVFGGQAFYRVRVDTYMKKGYSQQEATQKAYNDFVNATRRTQQSGAVEDLSHAQKGTVGKFITQFKNSPMQYYRGESMALTNFFQGVKQGDKAKAVQGMKNFAMYHFVLPQLFHAASNGFYLGDNDKKWLDDPMTLVVALGGSTMYYPIIGSIAQHVLQSQITGKSFGADTGVFEDILEEGTDALDTVGEIINEIGDPGEFKITSDDIWAFFNSVGAFAGVPVKAPENIAKGWKQYLSGETDDWTSLIGISPYMRGDYNRSNNYPMIHKHLPENGGSLETMREEYKEQHGGAATDKAWNYLKKEYQMYERFGGADRHVNYIYSIPDPQEQATYIYELYKRRVEGERPLRKNVSIAEIAKKHSIYRGEFEDWVAELAAFGVINKGARNKVYSMIDGMYEEIYEYDY